MAKTNAGTLALVLTMLDCYIKSIDQAYGEAIKHNKKTIEIPIDDVRKAVRIALAYKERLEHIEIDTCGPYESAIIRYF